MNGDFRFSHDVGHSVHTVLTLTFSERDHRQTTAFVVLLNLSLRGSHNVERTARTWVVSCNHLRERALNNSELLQETIVYEMVTNLGGHPHLNGSNKTVAWQVEDCLVECP